jgi:hypothetical protein
LSGRVRELSESGGRSIFIWPAGHVVIMDSWFAERFPDLEDSVLNTPWDLAIWDGFRLPANGSTSQRLHLLDRLAKTPAVDRVLLLSHQNHPAEDLPELAAFKRTTWNRTSLDLPDLSMPTPEWHESQIVYRRSESEKEIERALQHFVERWRAGSSPLSPVDRLLAAADSSPLALQEYLQRLRPSKASILLRQSAHLDEDDYEEPEDEPKQSSRSSLEQRAVEAAELLDLVDRLTIDSKLEALQLYLREQAPDARQVITCRFTATARYLRSALSDLPLRTHLATADIPSREILRLLSEFETQGGVLVTSMTALQAVALETDSVIIYDNVGPWMRTTFRSHVRPRGGALSLRILYLVDEIRSAEPMPQA